METSVLLKQIEFKNQTTAYVRGRCLFHAAMFFEEPCAEFWLSLARLSEAIVLFDQLFFTATEGTKAGNSSIFDHPFLNKCCLEGVIQIVPHSEIGNQENWVKAFDRYAAGMQAALPKNLDEGTLVDLVNDVAGRFAVESDSYNSLAHALRKDRKIYYVTKDEPSGYLRDIALEIGLHSLCDTLGLSLVDDPLLEINSLDLYSKGITQQNYEAIRKIVNDDIANLLKKRGIFSLNFSPIIHIALERAVQARSDLFDELMKLRDDFSQYRQKMAEMDRVITETASLGKALEYRYKWVEQIQSSLAAYWAKGTGKMKFLEAIDASIAEGGDVSISLGGLFKLIMHGAKTSIVRSRARPLFDLLDHLRSLNIQSELLKDAFMWCPSQQNQHQVTSIYGSKKYAIESSDYLDVARREFLDSHGKYGLDNSDDTIED